MLTIVAAALLAVALRWYVVVHAQVLQPLDDPEVRGDAVDYFRYAWNLVHHGTFAITLPGAGAPLPDSYRDPGYPLFLAAWMVVFPAFSTWYAAVLLSQGVLWGITVACLGLALRRAVPSWALAIALFLAAAWPHTVAMSAYVLSENLTAATWAAALLATQLAARQPSALRCILAGLLFACAGLTNAVLAPLIVPVAALLRWRHAMAWQPLAIMLAAALAPIAAWGARQADLAADGTSAYRATQNFVQGSWPLYHEAYRRHAYGDADADRVLAAIDSEIEAVHAAARDGLRIIGDRMGAHPWMYAGWYVSKPGLLWGWDIRIGQGGIYVYPTRGSPYEKQPVFRATEAIAFVLNPVLAVLALGGLGFVLARRDAPAPLIVVATTVAWVTLVYGVLQSEPRYAIPFRGAEFVLAAVALDGLRRLISRPETQYA
ncbi:hypothetical protein [Luteibacter yeojuensis]|uniref:Glycosyltransferase RgtA/B/C/D-like domain-containing protein n=1 Tax=Luteibacter yeojuensis TaxID=345309 RepID=A0A0F3KIU9_9GAMM|nr:hypothetical protein [Luteibacter yeojuensis]KJV30932.1 hypothetical protein VI08_14395 [Luteibacter yeojuensis]